MYFGIFHGGTYRDGTLGFLRRARSRFGDKPLMATEFGFWSSPATEDRFWLFRSPRRDRRDVHGRWEGRQVEVLEETAAAFEAFLAEGGTLAGVVWWCAFDWYRHVPGVQTMGLVRMDRRTEKPVAGRIREWFRRLDAAFDQRRS
jgi:beta-glucuronidase